MNKYLKKVMINFKQFLEEAKKKKIPKIQAKAICKPYGKAKSAQ
jgi:hypothetical protein